MALKDSPYSKEFLDSDPGYLARKDEFNRILVEAFENNTFDYVPMHRALRKIHDNAYSSTLRLQRSQSGYTEAFFFSNDDTHYDDTQSSDERHHWKQNVVRPGNLYVDEHGYACIDYEFSFISVPNREDFRRSRFYKKWFSFEDIVRNHRLTHGNYYADEEGIRSIFTKIPVLIIDNHVMFDYEIYIDRSYMKFRLPFKSDFVYRHERNLEADRLVYVDHQITIQMVDNVFWCRRNSIVLGDLTTWNPDDNKLKIPIRYITGSVEYNQFYGALPHKLDSRHGLYMASLNFYSQTDRYPELGSFLMDARITGTETDSYLEISLDYLTWKKLTDAGASCTFTVNLVWYNNLYKHKFFNGDDFILADTSGKCIVPVIQQGELDPHSMPVPVENLMIVRTAHPMPIDETVEDTTTRDKVSKEKYDDLDGVVFYVSLDEDYFVRRNGKWHNITEFFITGGKSISQNTHTVTLHYPNIYEITDKACEPGNKYEIYYFYNEDEVYNYRYTPLTVFYHYYLKYACSVDKANLVSIEEVISSIVNGRSYTTNFAYPTMTSEEKEAFMSYFKRIYAYDYYDYIYGDVDFYHKFVGNNSFYDPENPVVGDLEDDKYPIEYKIARLREWIRQDQDYLRDYVNDQKKLGKNLHLFVSDIKDLDKRARETTYPEEPKESAHKLSKPSYVFSLQNDDPSEELSCIVWVDGLMCLELYQFNDMYTTYLYIPQDMVTKDSYIEIELRPSYSFTHEVTFNSLGDEKIITMVAPEDGIFPTIADLYITDTRESNYKTEFTDHFILDSDGNMLNKNLITVSAMTDDKLSSSAEIPAATSLIFDTSRLTWIVGITATFAGGTGPNIRKTKIKVSKNGPLDETAPEWITLGDLTSRDLYGAFTIMSNNINDQGVGTIKIGRLFEKYRYVCIETPAGSTINVSNIEVTRRPFESESVDHVYENTHFELVAHYKNMSNQSQYVLCEDGEDGSLEVVDETTSIHANDVEHANSGIEPGVFVKSVDGQYFICPASDRMALPVIADDSEETTGVSRHNALMNLGKIKVGNYVKVVGDYDKLEARYYYICDKDEPGALRVVDSNTAVHIYIVKTSLPKIQLGQHVKYLPWNPAYDISPEIDTRSAGSTKRELLWKDGTNNAYVYRDTYATGTEYRCTIPNEIIDQVNVNKQPPRDKDIVIVDEGPIEDALRGMVRFSFKLSSGDPVGSISFISGDSPEGTTPSDVSPEVAQKIANFIRFTNSIDSSAPSGTINFVSNCSETYDASEELTPEERVISQKMNEFFTFSMNIISDAPEGSVNFAIDNVDGEESVIASPRRWDVHGSTHTMPKFTRLVTFTIKPKTLDVVNVPLKIRFSKIPQLLRVTMDYTGIPYISLVDRDFKRNSEYIRVFREGKLIDFSKCEIAPTVKDGRLYPREKYQFISSHDHPRLMIYDVFDKGETFYVDISPFRYKEIYHQEHLQSGEVLIDLSEVITKPFDWRYYEVYLNGRRLSLPNIVSVDAWSITLINLFSDAHLQIFERERDWEYFGLDYKDRGLFFFTKEDVLNAKFVDEETRNHLIETVIDDYAKEEGFEVFKNINVENEMDFTDFSSFYNMLIFYQHELVPKTFVNPDIVQASESLLLDEYGPVYDLYKVNSSVPTMLLDPDKRWTPSGVPAVDGVDPTSVTHIVEIVGLSDEDYYDNLPNLLAKPPVIKDETKIGGE